MAATVINKHMKQTNCQENITKQKTEKQTRQLHQIQKEIQNKQVATKDN